MYKPMDTDMIGDRHQVDAHRPPRPSNEDRMARRGSVNAVAAAAASGLRRLADLLDPLPARRRPASTRV